MDSVFCLPRFRWVYERLKLRLRPAEIIDVDEVREVLAEYGLSLTATPRPPATLGRSSSLVVDTSIGRAMLKRYKPTVNLSAVVHEHSILTYLAQANFPAPRLLTTRSDATFVHRQGATYALFDFLEGYTQYSNYYLVVPAHRRQFVSTSGETLAILHQRLKGFVPKGRNPNGFKSLRGDRWRDLAWCVDRLTHCTVETPRLNAAGDDAFTVAQSLLERADWIHDTLHQLDHVLREAAPPRLIIHGDYRPSNLLFRQNASPVVIDFELARLDWRITDLAKSIPSFAYKRMLGVDFGRMRCFMDAYQARYPISAEELELIPAVWQFLAIRRVIACWYTYCNTLVNRLGNEIRHHLKWLDWAIDHEDKLLDHLIATCKSD